MTRGSFQPGFETLPRIIPVFPLTGALLLPGGRLPLNIFEPRYLAMVRAALAEEHRIVGMIQPRAPDPGDNLGRGAAAAGAPPAIYDVGCAGRITEFSETDDGRYLVTLTGVCRFAVADELAVKDGYRRVLADYRRFRADLGAGAAAEVDRARLLAALKAYFAGQEISADWEAIESTPDERLVTSLAMTCPFGPTERQALLEAPDLGARARVMVTLLEMAALETGGASEANH